MRLRLKDFMTYGSDEDGGAVGLDFEGAVLWSISGPNGAGKSAIFDAITWCLFGVHRGGIQQFERLVRQGAKECMVSLEFRVGPTTYRATRRAQRTRGGTARQDRSLERWDAGTGRWEPVPDTQSSDGFARFIGENLRLRYETFVASTMLLQGKSDRLIEAKPADRFKILAGILDLGFFERLSALADELARDHERDEKRLTQELHGTAEVHPSAVEALQADLSRCRREHDEAKTDLIEAEFAAADARRFSDLAVSVAATDRELEVTRTLQGERAAVEAEFREFTELGSVVPAMERVVALLEQAEEHDIAAREKEREAAGVDLDLVDREREAAHRRMETAAGTAADLITRATDSALRLERIVAEVAEVTEYEEQADEVGRLDQSIDSLQRELRALPVARTMLAELELANEAWPAARRIHELRERTATREAAARDAGDPSELGDELGRCERELADAAGRVSIARSELADAQGAFTRAEAASESLTEELSARKDASVEQTCSRCGQPITPEHIASEIDAVTRELAAAAERCTGLTSTVEAARAQLDSAIADERRLDRRRGEIAASHAAATAAASEVRSARAALDAAVSELSELDSGVRLRVDQAVAAGKEGVAACAVPPLKLVRARERVEELVVNEGALRELKREREIAAASLIEHASVAEHAERDRRRNALETARAEHDDLTARLEDARRAHGDARTAAQAADAAYEDARARQAELRRLTEDSRGGAKSCRETADLVLAPSSEWGRAVRRRGAAYLRECRERLNALAHAADRRRALEEADGRARELAAALEVLRSEIAGIPESHRIDPDTARSRRQDTQARELRTQTEITATELALRALENAQADRSALAVRVDAAARQAYLARRLADLLGRTQLQADLLTRATRTIEGLANEMLRRTSHGELEVNVAVRPEKGEQKVAIEFIDHASGDAPQDLLFASGGQKFRLAVALAGAIGQCAAGGGPATRSLIVDEGFGSLDVDGRRDMIDELRSLAVHMERIVVVSHHDEFWDATLFPSGYRITKQDRQSRVERRL